MAAPEQLTLDSTRKKKRLIDTISSFQQRQASLAGDVDAFAASLLPADVGGGGRAAVVEALRLAHKALFGFASATAAVVAGLAGGGGGEGTGAGGGGGGGATAQAAALRTPSAQEDQNQGGERGDDDEPPARKRARVAAGTGARAAAAAATAAAPATAAPRAAALFSSSSSSSGASPSPSSSTSFEDNDDSEEEDDDDEDDEDDEDEDEDDEDEDEDEDDDSDGGESGGVDGAGGGGSSFSTSSEDEDEGGESGGRGGAGEGAGAGAGAGGGGGQDDVFVFASQPVTRSMLSDRTIQFHSYVVRALSLTEGAPDSVQRVTSGADSRKETRRFAVFALRSAPARRGPSSWEPPARGAPGTQVFASDVASYNVFRRIKGKIYVAHKLVPSFCCFQRRGDSGVTTAEQEGALRDAEVGDELVLARRGMDRELFLWLVKRTQV